jgi:signal transduction histidine kinase/ActR/RegA family two-component response regulator
MKPESLIAADPLPPIVGKSHYTVFTVLILLTLICATWFAMQWTRQLEQKSIALSLTTIVGITNQATATWAQQERREVKQWASSNEIRDFVKDLLDVELSKTELLTSASQQKTREWIGRITAAKGYEGFFLIGPDNTNLSSSRDSNLGQPNLLYDGHEDFLARMWSGETVLVPPMKSDVKLKSASGDLVDDRATMFIGTPIRDSSGEILALLTFRLNPELVLAPFFDRGETGESGETYALNKDGTFLTESRFIEEIQFLGLVPPSSSAVLNLQSIDPGTNLLNDQKPPQGERPLTEMARSLTAGNSGVNTFGYRDYRGVMVVGAWIWSEELGVGISTEMDRDEAYSAIWATEGVVIALGLLACILLTTTSGLLVLARKREAQAANLRRQKRTAVEVGKAKSDFLARMSHEIRTPMNGVLGMLETLLSADLKKEQREQADIAYMSASLLLRTLNDILDFSKIEAGQLDFESIPFEMSKVLAVPVSTFSQSAKKNGVQLTCDLEPSTPKWVMGDPSRLQQVLVNLISNAIKFTRNGEVRLIVGPHVNHDGVAGIDFRVEDTGVGIEANRMHHIFDKFTQADVSTSRSYGGTGLGLSIAQHLVNGMGGQLTVESKIGAGSQFHFTLPLPATTPQNQAQAKKPTEAQGREVQRGSDTAAKEIAPNLRVLVVDDNRVNLVVAQAMLKKLGHSAVLASSGAEALQIISTSKFDLILMDVEMPDMDGTETTRRVRKLGEMEQLPIIAVTAHALPEYREHCQSAGMTGFMTKPFTSEHLRNAIASCNVHLTQTSGSMKSLD